jgi:hypothetical protein
MVSAPESSFPGSVWLARGPAVEDLPDSNADAKTSATSKYE